MDLKRTLPKRSVFYLGIIVFLFALSIRLWGLNEMGNVWDEYFYYDASHSFANNIANLDFDANNWQDNFEHPPLGKYIYLPALIWNKYHFISDEANYFVPRFISAIIGSITVLLVFLLGQKFFSLKIGLVASLIYSVIPVVVAYNQIICLDVTLLLFYTLSMYFLFAWLENQKNSSLWLSVLFASLAFTTKFNAVLILIIYLGVVLIGQWRSIKKHQSLVIPLPLVLAFPIMIGLLVLIWPWLWQNTLDHFLTTLTHWGGEIKEIFLGQYKTSPIYYFLVHFLLETPTVLLVLLILGIYQITKVKKLKKWVLLLWFLIPFLISFYHLRQDNLRYILPSLPALTLICSLGFWRIFDIVKRGKTLLWTPIIPAFGIAVLLIYLFINLWLIHPYYLNYFNALVGGSKNVGEKNLFLLGYYGEGIKEATQYVNRLATDNSRVHYEIVPDDAPYLDRSRLTRYDHEGADYLIFNDVALHHPEKKKEIDTTNYEKVYAVKSGGAEFVWVYQLKEKNDE